MHFILYFCGVPTSYYNCPCVSVYAREKYYWNQKQATMTTIYVCVLGCKNAFVIKIFGINNMHRSYNFNAKRKDFNFISVFDWNLLSLKKISVSSMKFFCQLASDCECMNVFEDIKMPSYTAWMLQGVLIKL